uniref:Uncharacterized protein n=1 Tax=Arundo donax TaxID=35708 RepID=A0A0A9DEA2_ARUDO
MEASLLTSMHRCLSLRSSFPVIFYSSSSRALLARFKVSNEAMHSHSP